MTKVPTTIACPECSKPMTLRPSRYGQFFGCSDYPKCDGTHGAHPDGTPLGIPATKETKLARVEAHEAFDRMWKQHGMTRKEAYAWLRKELRMTKEQCHIGKFDKDECGSVVLVVQEFEAAQ